MGLVAINVAAILFVVVGYQIAFRQTRVWRWRARLLGPAAPSDQPERSAPDEDRDGVAAVMRMVGVMVMAFSFTAGAFADLIAYFTATSPY